MRLFLVNMTYPHRKVATQVGCVKTCWKYRWVGRLPVVAENAVQAAEMLEKHCASCTIYVSEHRLSRTPGIKFAIQGNADDKYRVRKGETGYWPEHVEDSWT